MLVDQVRQLLAQGEGLTVEFKSVESGKLGSPVFETIAAFSNRYGGHLLRGVADDGAVLGNATLSRGELAQAAGITERQVSRLLTQLRERGLITREGGNRYGRWKVRAAEDDA